MNYEFYCLTCKGRRHSNQDSIYACTAESGRKTVILASVCDGVGGLKRGEYASAEVVFALDRWFRTCAPGFSEDRSLNRTVDSLRSCVSEAGRRIRKNDPEGGSCGTTAVVFYAVGRKYVVLNIGDSRLYRIRGKNCRLLTVDQTAAMREVRRGRMSEEAARKSPDSHVLLQCVGGSEDPVPDLFYGVVSSGDRYLLCSDGFRNTIADREFGRRFGESLKSGDSLQKALNETAREILRRGEQDNLSAVLIDISGR